MPKRNTQRTIIEQTDNMHELIARAEIIPESIDKEARTVRVQYTSGARVFRPQWFGEDYYEELSTEKGHVRLDRFEQGAVPVLDSHNGYGLNSVLGTVLEADETHALIKITGREDREGLWQDILDGIIRSISVGYRVYEYEDVTPDRKAEEVRVLRAIDWEPIEISFVSIPADPQAGVRNLNQPYRCVVTGARAELNQKEEKPMAKKNEKGSRADDENTRNEEDNAPATEAETPETENEDTPETEVETPAAETKTETPEDGERSGKQTAADIAKGERTRAAEIRKMVRGLDLEESMADNLIERGVTLDQARAEVINKMARQDENTDTRSNITVGKTEHESRRGAIENAILHRSNPGKVELTEHAREYRGLSLIELAREVVGHRETRGMSKREVAERAFHSTSDFPEILANIASKSLRAAYGDTRRSFTPFSRQTTLPDFKEAKRIALSNASSLVQIPEGGEYKQGTFSEGAETIQLFTYGRKLAITRQMIINDDLDAFTRVPQKMAAASARLENKMVYDILNTNPLMADGDALFDAAHGNLTDALLGIDGIGELRKLMRLQTDPSGEDILNIEPRYLIVPAALEVAAARLKAQLTPNQTSQVNPLSNTFDIIVEGYLDATSPSHYFMAADPSEIDTIEYAYLEGEAGPYIESRNGFDVDGLEIKVRHDFAAKPIDHRGLGKSTNDAS